MGMTPRLRARFDAAFRRGDWQEMFQVMKEMRNW